MALSDQKRVARRAALALLLFFTVLTLLPAQQDSEVSRGRTLFQAECASCHSIGRGDIVGPDLAGVTSRRDVKWLDRFIREPDMVIAEKDGTALALLKKYNGIPMPNLGISEADAVPLLAYLSTGKSAAAGAATKSTEAEGQPAVARAAPPPAGDAASGASFFEGTRRFQNDGTQCMACHTISSLAIPGGGALGPDLTGAVKKYGGPSGMISVLAGIPFPTMAPVYKGRPLTPAERADLTAYIGEAAGTTVNMTVFVICLGIWIMGGLFMILHAIWSGRLRRVRKSLKAR